MQGDVDVSRLSIFQEQHLVLAEWGVHIHAGIIGTSHFVQVKHADGRIFTELFACDVLANENNTPLYFAPIEELPSQIALEQYSFKNTLKRYDLEASNITNWINNQDQALINMTFHFEAATPDLPSSRTVLVVNKLAAAKGIQINTIHEYQEENAIVLSESVLYLD